MIGTEPDAWDECAMCGHDRDEHDFAGCRALTRRMPDSPFRVVCDCLGFVDGPEAA